MIHMMPASLHIFFGSGSDINGFLSAAGEIRGCMKVAR